ncbi:putative ABC transporter ATP-binding protein [Abditibacteriota bacterium]|nr:putative ABC transporter ATP-binding protein [Abditibacteriota bacterium]
MPVNNPSLAGPRGKLSRAAATAHHKPRDTRATLRRLWRYLMPQKKGLISMAILIAVGAGLDALGPFLLGRAIDLGVIPRDLDILVKIAAVMLGVYIVNAFINWAQTWVMTAIAAKVIADVRTDLFAQLGHLPLEFFDKRAHGDIMSRLTNDVETINTFIGNATQQVFSGVLSTLAIAGVMFYLSPPLAVVTILATACLTFAANSWLAKHTREGFRAQQGDLGELNGYIEEIIGGARVVRACGRGESEIESFRAQNETLRKSSTRAQIYAGFAGPLMNTITNTGLAAVGGFGGILVLNGLASVGLIATFLNYARQFGRPLNDIANTYNTMQSALAAAERVFEVLDETPEIDAVPENALASIEGEVEFENVFFGYEPSRMILKDINLRARSGETIALIGPTGAGKTTVVNLLTRFYEIQEGTIRIDGHDLREFPKHELREQIAVVLQDTYLFSGTVAQNIAYGRLDASREAIIEAAQQAHAHGFITHLPHGYDSLVGERGGNLSQGQRQLIAIARAILADPRIFILDEATSSVDTRTERQIQEAMRALMRGRTSFVIAHRLSTIRDADQILVIQAGQITERGNHAQLAQAGGFYARALGRVPASPHHQALTLDAESFYPMRRVG